MRKLLLLLFVPGIVSLSHAQQYLGVRNSNYAGILGATLNPSSMVNSKLDWDINLLSLSLTADNNFLYIPKDSLEFFAFGNTIDLIKNKRYITRFDPNDPNHTYDFTVSAEGLGPSFMFKFAKKHALGVTTAARFYAIVNDGPGHQGQQAYFENRDSTLWGFNWADDGSQLNTMGWFEYGLNYAVRFYDKNRNQISGGATIKYLQGAGAGYVRDVVGTYNIADRDSLYYFSGSADYGRTDYNTFDPIENYDDLIKGDGWGGSIGFTYTRLKADSADYTYEMDCKTWMDPNKVNYIFRIGASLTDIGKINFDEQSATFQIQSDNALWLNWRAEKFESNIDFDRSLSYIFYGDSSASLRESSFKMSLPTSLNLQADWNFYKNFFLNATIVKGFHANSGQGVTRPDVYSLTPRYENKWFEVSAPISLLSYHHLQPRVGLCVRAGYFFIGGDALGGVFGTSDFEGVDIYGGFHVFFPHRRLRDDDGDSVSNKMDSCLTEKGPCLTHGCPDRDHDGTIDMKDECPDDPGPKELKGCPDRDGDGIIDKKDECPDEPGLPEFNGCPDRDGDGIQDKNDDCPDVPGLPQFAGCPDTDGDGIPDNKDECPTEPGPASLNGCPDRDGDGVPDKTDKCPDVPGPKENFGCPLKISDDELNRIKLSSQSILFKTGSAVIEPNVYQVLDVVAEIMKKYPMAKWNVEGYADITGSVQLNLDLTKRRAEAVRDYLMKKGVSGDNMNTVGYGKTKFVATNKTAAGRAKNRRVEIKLVE